MQYKHIKTAKFMALSGAVSSLVWFMWPTTNGWSFSWSPFWATISGSAAFLFSEWEESKKVALSNCIEQMICEHDIQLINEFRDLLPSDGRTMNFFREQDLGHSFNGEVLINSDIFQGNWQHAERSFQDKELESAKQKLIEINNSFRRVLMQNVGPTPAGDGWLSVVDFKYDDYNIPEDIQAAVRKLNEIGSEFTDLHQDFTKLCNKKIAQREKALTQLSI